MRNTSRRNTLLDMTPFVLTAYPVLYLLSANVELVDFTDATLSLSGYLAGTLLLLTLYRALLKDRLKAVFLANVTVIIFFTYGHVYHVIGSEPGHRLLLPLSLALIGLSFYVVRKRSWWLVDIVKFMGVAGGVLALIAIGNVLYYHLIVKSSATDFSIDRVFASVDLSVVDPEMLNTDVALDIDDPAALPDMYYIILDEYAGSDALMELFGFDNGPFLDALRQRGFYVADESRANYPVTFLSLASSLNMGYMNFLAGEERDFTIPYHLIDYNRVSNILRKAGYQIVYFPSIYYVTKDMESADLTYKFERELPLIGLEYGNFDLELMDSTLIGTLLNNEENHDVLGEYRETTLYTLDNLRQIPLLDGPTFTFAHITVPHKPYVFTAADASASPGGTPVDGQIVRDGSYAPYMAESGGGDYLAQLNFINRAIAALVDDIIAQSDVAPVIIVQSDHGHRMVNEPGVEDWGPQEIYQYVFPILNVYYLPGYDGQALHPAITPVNTFRVVLDHYLGTDLGMVEERNFYPVDYFSYDFIEVTNGVVQSREVPAEE